jgi:polysaccharide export outer membrane protein
MALGAALFLMACIAGCSTFQYSQKSSSKKYLNNMGMTAAKADSSFKIRPGDAIKIAVTGHANLDTTDTVSTEGYMIVPLVGRMYVVGLTAPQLKRRLKKRFAKYIKGAVSLTVYVQRIKREEVSVFGRVNKPNVYQISDTTSIFKMLSIAGGPTDEANIKKVRVYHRFGKHKYHVLNLSHYLKKGEVEQAPKVYPGDIIYVPKKVPVVKYILQFLESGVVVYGIFKFIH